MRAAALVVVAVPAALAACVHESPLDPRPDLLLNGGSIVPPGCTHTVTTRVGAEAPALATAELGRDPTIKQVHLGLAGDPRTSIVVSWRTVDDLTRAGAVRFGTGGVLDREVTGLTFGYRAGIGGAGDVVQVHEAHLCGLAPGTTYQYQVVSDAGHMSPVRDLRTAPDIAAAPDAEVIIATVGDSRDGYEVWADVVAELATRSPDLIVFSGDAVTFGPLQAEWEEFFAVGEPLFSRVPVISAHGNHELNAIGFYSQLAMPGDEENFGFDYGHAHLTVLNDSPEQIAALTGTTKDFLRADLTASADRRWKLVSHHRPVYSASTRHGSDLTLRQEWAPLFDQFHVDLVLNGHDHGYERTWPMKNAQIQPSPADGTVYVVSGGAGAELYQSGSDYWTERHASLHSAATLRVRRDLLELTAFDHRGALVDSFVIVKP